MKINFKPWALSTLHVLGAYFIACVFTSGPWSSDFYSLFFGLACYGIFLHALLDGGSK